MKYLDDLDAMVARLPYGKLNISLVKKAREVILVVNGGLETKRYEDNEEAFLDIVARLKKYAKATPNATIKLELNLTDGLIKEVAYTYNPSNTYGL